MPKGVPIAGLLSRAYIPKACISPTSRDLEWAAGFMEGEGCFTCVRPGGNARANAAQVNKEPVQRLQNMFGGSLTLYAPRNSKHSEIWRWQVCGARARGVMMTLYSLLSVRRKQQIRRALGLA